MLRVNKQSQKAGSSAGFTIIEMMIALLILTIITGIAFRQIALIQKRGQTEATKLDLTSESREFLDTIVRDLHSSGYPKGAMYNATTLNAKQPFDDTTLAAGIVEVTPTSILFEGDISGDNNVYSVWYYYLASDANDPSCPCIRRDAVRKQPPGDPVNQTPWSLYQTLSTSVTEVQYVVPPGTAAGQSGEDLFTYFDATGNQIKPTGTCTTTNPIAPPPAGACWDIGTPAGQKFLDSIRTIKINVMVRSTGLQVDPQTKQPITISMSATARMNNGCLNNPGDTTNGCANSGL
jgi:prepilin-type N-terminal cleavage/methylation domain-containing protein